MNVWSVAALGIGVMVVAGIFALLGRVAFIARGAVWIAFANGGAIAMFSGYSYSRLAAKYPSDTGVVAFFDAAFLRWEEVDRLMTTLRSRQNHC